MNLEWSGIHAEFKKDWKTPEILLEGSLGCGKTTVALDKEIDALLKWPGIPILLFRWTEDAVATKLKVAFDEILSLRGLEASWDAKQKCYTFPNGSTAFMFGLKAVSAVEMFNKIRGLSVGRIMGDQVEEANKDVAAELRGRLRPDLTATMRGVRYPFQLTFVANPSDTNFWLSKEFPIGDKIKGRRLFSLSVFDNPHLPKETIEGLMRAWPEDHPRYLTMVLGKRGPNVMGEAVFKGIYKKDLHWRQVQIRSDVPILESFEMGTHSPTWVFCQQMPSGGLAVLGGIRGEDMVLEDFCAVVEKYRRLWFPPHLPVKTCVAPLGDSLKKMGQRYTLTDVLKRQLGLSPRVAEMGNAPDVRLALIENLASYQRKRNATGDECFAVNKDPEMFLLADKEGTKPVPFVHYAMEAGFVWDDHFTSVANKDIRTCLEDDQFANAMHCIENIELNYCAGQLTPNEQAQKRKANQRPSYAPQTPHGPSGWMLH